MLMESVMIKGHGNVRKRTKKSIGGLTHNKKVYRDEVRASKRCTFFMSNLERLCVFINFFVNNLLSWSAGKILVKSIQFPVKIGGFFLSSFISFL